MNARDLAVPTFVVAALALAACNDSTPVATEGIATAAQGPTFAAGSSNGPVFQTKIHDDYASYHSSSWDENTSRHLAVWIGRAGPGPDAQAWLSFYASECTQSGPEWWDYVCSDFGGWGTIPARDVSGSFGSGLAVDTDLRNNPDFWLWGTAPGIVSVRWQRTGWYEGRNSGSWEFRWGNYLSRQAGVSRSSSATARGEVLGNSLAEDGWGDVYSGRGVNMQFERVTPN